MRSDYFRVLIFACVLIVLDGCAAPPSGPASTALAPIRENAPLDPSFKQGFGVLSAMFNPRPAEIDKISDWVLLGVKVTKDDHDEVWFVRLSTLPPRDSKTAQASSRFTREFSVPFGIGSVKSGTKLTTPVNRVLVETFDSEGTPLRTSIRSVPRMPEAPSVLDLWRELAWPTGSLFGDRRVANDSVASMMMTLQSLGTSGALRPIRDAARKDIIKQPKILGLLLNGLRFTVEADFSRSELVKSVDTEDDAAAPRYQIDFPVSLTGQKMFNCRLVCGPPTTPYHLLGGALLFEAVHPDKPRNRLSVRVLAAQTAKATQTLASIR
jgi:hypothetical protein